MAKKDSLETYIKKSQKGDKDAYRKVIAELYSEIYNLSAFIYEDDETREKLTKHLFIKAFKSIADFDSEECDIHLWMAREATKEIYNVAVKRGDDMFSDEIEQRDYSYESIEEDDELGEASAEFNEAFLTEEGFDPAVEFAANLTIGEKIIYLLYCYEGYTIDEIESIIEIDSSFIMSEIAGMRDGVLAEYAPIKAENDGVVEDVLADSAIAAGYGNDDGDADSEDSEYESEDEYDEDSEYEEDDDFFESERQSRARIIADRNKKKYAIGKLRLTEKELKGLIIGVVAAVVLIIVIVIVVVASGHNRNRNNNAATTGATKPQVTNNTTAEPTTAQEETTTEEETTTKKKVQQGTQPQVEINTTTAAPATEAPTPATPTKATAQTPEQKPVVPPVNNNSNNNGANGGNNAVGGDGNASGGNNAAGGDSNTSGGNNAAGGGSNTSGGNNAAGGGSNTSGGNNAAGGGSNTSGGNNTAGEGSNTSGVNNTAGGGSNTSEGNNTAGGSNNAGGDNTSNNSGNTTNESSNTGNNVQQQ